MVLVANNNIKYCTGIENTVEEIKKNGQNVKIISSGKL